ncbi:lipopolysaccharide-induced tumor necrosis factor-alpha factor homolog [Babylonia areolata]|uniref:lipopolysaccharide-induced tumor necrosis factor-alpha factor homolog n=1 Tax=Babylonia areolata TaxID=304850 RepID=UPI003FD28AC6
MADAPPPYSEVPKGDKGAPDYPPATGYGTTQAGGYPPPQAGYPPPQGGYPPTQPGYQTGSTSATVVVNQPAVTVVQTFTETPVRTQCPHCRADIITATTYDAGTFSWLICVILCLVGCNLGCCLLPFCMDGCQDVVHSCPNCRQQISRWGRM